jgi:hypothetical protein
MIRTLLVVSVMLGSQTQAAIAQTAGITIDPRPRLSVVVTRSSCVGLGVMAAIEARSVGLSGLRATSHQ